jgi:uncharacterized protein (DUF2236 family)
MDATELPSVNEARALVPGPGSMTWRYAGDVRVLAAAGYALLLQVAHPTVAAGVREHSNYAEDPWGRLLRTLDYTNVVVYGGAEAAVTAAHQLRRRHEQIKGTTPEGRSYHALEPEAFAWVHATLVEAIVSGHRQFGRRLGEAEVERLYGEWRAMGRLIGVRESDLPQGWEGFRGYFDAMVTERLEDNDVVHGVLASLARPASPPVPLLTEWTWRIGRIPLGRLIWLATVGLLSPVLRDRCGLGWSRAEALQLAAMSTALRSVTPVVRGPLANYGPRYLSWRRLAPAAG